MESKQVLIRGMDTVIQEFNDKMTRDLARLLTLNPNNSEIREIFTTFYETIEIFFGDGVGFIILQEDIPMLIDALKVLKTLLENDSGHAFKKIFH